MNWPFLQTFTYDSNWVHSGEFMTFIVHDEYLCPIHGPAFMYEDMASIPHRVWCGEVK